MFLFYNVHKEKMFTIEIEDGNEAPCNPVCIMFIYTLLVWVFVCTLFVFNRLQNSWTDRANILCETSHDPREVLLIIKNLPPTKFNFHFLKIHEDLYKKSANLFYNFGQNKWFLGDLLVYFWKKNIKKNKKVGFRCRIFHYFLPNHLKLFWKIYTPV